MVGFRDVPKPGISDAIGRMREMGVRLVMATGDYSITACAIASQVGMLTDQFKYDTLLKLRQPGHASSKKVGEL